MFTFTAVHVSIDTITHHLLYHINRGFQVNCLKETDFLMTEKGGNKQNIFVPPFIQAVDNIY